ncbi:LacI family DNA-binding transcriptional regulator [Mangrovihabitans endophyticus]|uniref:LacI family transcriptional regulator n=1 Tax=Mangrovihabitans endophyticus TaxID=1751298 RepID=A0A8J3FN16_9ACTN|nr:LacI family DNA-binding transcriptional regulator [Mangrovihabitans endophyticus]GGK77702.1 LacI family transcriptional regulator [Mangrovihabitans endophyticus]
MRVRIVDVAALAGVTPGTASKALNGTGQLRADTRERVIRAAEQLGFTPDGIGRGLSSGRSYTVGLVTTDSFGRFSMPILLGAEDALAAGQMAVLLCDTRDDPVREKHHLRNLVARRVDGVILTGRRTDPRPPVAMPVPVPVVHVFTPSADPAAVSVIADDADGARLAVAHLRDLGRRRIAHVTGPQRHQSAAIRAQSAVAAAGPAFAGPVRYGDWSERWGRQAVTLLLRHCPDVDAISCGSDQIARGVCDALREAGKRVPEDVAVTGYDNWDVMALASRPPLTTVDLQLEELGRCAAGFLLDAIAGRPRPGVTSLAPRLVIRESTAGD